MIRFTVLILLAGPVFAADPPPRLDAYGDPLPPGVVVRFGTERMTQATIHALQLLPNQHLAALGARGDYGDPKPSGTIWDLRTGNVIRKITPGTSRIFHSKDGAVQVDAIPHFDDYYHLVDPITGGVRLKRTGSLDAISPDGRLIVEREVNHLRIVDTAASIRTRPVLIHSRSECTAFTPDGQYLITVNHDLGELHYHDPKTGGLRCWRKFPQPDDVDPISHSDDPTYTFSADGRFLTIFDHRYDEKADRFRDRPETYVSIVDNTTGFTRHSMEISTQPPSQAQSKTGTENYAPSERMLQSLMLSPNGEYLSWIETTSENSGWWVVRELATGIEVRTNEHGGTQLDSFGASGFCWMPHGRGFAIPMGSGAICFFVPGGVEIPGPVQGPRSVHRICRPSPDGKTIETVDSYVKGWIWDTTTGKLLKGPVPATAPDTLTIQSSILPPLQDLRGRYRIGEQREYFECGSYTVFYAVIETATATTTTRLSHDSLALAFSPDGRVLYVSQHSPTVLGYSLLPAGWLEKPPPKPDALALERAWYELAVRDIHGHEAMWRLALFPDVSVPFLRKKLTERPVFTRTAIRNALIDLDADVFADRVAAMRLLRKAGRPVIGDLQTVAKKSPSPEVRDRAKQLLAEFDRLGGIPEELRSIRAVEALERAATPDAITLLKELTRSPDGFLAIQARDAEKRLRQK